MKLYRRAQDRNGDAGRRLLEFFAITHHVKTSKAKFIQRLTRRITRMGNCMVYDGSLDHKGYARLNLRYQGRHLSIHAHRLFLILRLGTPIPLGYEAGHTEECKHRTCVKHVRLEHYTSNAATRR